MFSRLPHRNEHELGHHRDPQVSSSSLTTNEAQSHPEKGRKASEVNPIPKTSDQQLTNFSLKISPLNKQEDHVSQNKENCI